MKTTITALILCITFSMQLFASQDVVIDHSNKTVTILANFISSAPISKSMKKAADKWNSKSGKYHYTMLVDGKKTDYNIQFKLVVNQNPLSDTVVNVIAVLPDNHPFFNNKIITDEEGIEHIDKTVSVTDRKTIAISTLYKNDVNVLAYEMGIAIGLNENTTSKNRIITSYNLENFDLEHSVSNLALLNGEKHRLTRKHVEIGNSTNYMATK